MRDDGDGACPYCGAARDAAETVAGVCPACGSWDPDGDANRPRLLAWIERTRLAAGKAARDGDLPLAPGEDGDPAISAGFKALGADPGE